MEPKDIAMLAIVVVGGGITLLLTFRRQAKRKKSIDSWRDQFDFGQSVLCGKYVAGHPAIDRPDDSIRIFATDGKLELFHHDVHGDQPPEYRASIPIAGVAGIKIEDATTMERRVTAGRLLAIGIFAFAAQKKTVTEIAYAVIEWNDGKFDHETIFELKGGSAFEAANAVRNKLIRFASA